MKIDFHMLWPTERLTQTDYAVVRRKAVGFGSEPEIRMKEL